MLLALLLVTGIHDARILGVFPYQANSHMVTMRVLTLELARRGHQVTEVTPSWRVNHSQLHTDRTEDRLRKIYRRKL
jgi:hypothetical protein